MASRAPMMNRVRRDAVHHVVMDDDATDDFGIDYRVDREHQAAPVTLAPVPWLARQLDFWDDPTEFAAGLVERRRAAGEP
jgi:hypothetical protein